MTDPVFHHLGVGGGVGASPRACFDNSRIMRANGKSLPSCAFAQADQRILTNEPRHVISNNVAL